ncbi:hypothetical protein [Streptomyces mirabilis]|uniref:hypothetical protein n=1 Tax=Streptomyces mirabilis TaxID=68239 RepID=UPI0036B37F01
MSDSLFTQLLDLACGAFLLAAVVVLWRRELAAIVRLFALQGLALAVIALLLGLHEDRWDLIVVAAGIGALRAGLLCSRTVRSSVSVPSSPPRWLPPRRRRVPSP